MQTVHSACNCLKGFHDHTSFAASASNESPRRPSLRSAVSADFLESETTHTPRSRIAGAA